MALVASNVDNLVKGKVTVMDNVLYLLAVTRSLFKTLDDKTSGRWQSLDSGNTVNNCKLDTDTETLVFLSLLGNIFRYFLSGL